MATNKICSICGEEAPEKDLENPYTANPVCVECHDKIINGGYDEYTP